MRGPVVLLHGLPFHKGLWGPIRAEPGAPREVWAPDLPGYGDATRLTEAPSIAAHLRWLRQGLAQRGLEAGPGLHLVGHEYGGLLWGEADRTFPLAVGRQLAAAMPPARLFTVPGARHLGLWTHPAEFARRLWAP